VFSTIRSLQTAKAQYLGAATFCLHRRCGSRTPKNESALPQSRETIANCGTTARYTEQNLWSASPTRFTSARNAGSKKFSLENYFRILASTDALTCRPVRGVVPASIF
jgi:hypothetical protein